MEGTFLVILAVVTLDMVLVRATTGGFIFYNVFLMTLWKG